MQSVFFSVAESTYTLDHLIAHTSKNGISSHLLLKRADHLHMLSGREPIDAQHDAKSFDKIIDENEIQLHLGSMHLSSEEELACYH